MSPVDPVYAEYYSARDGHQIAHAAYIAAYADGNLADQAIALEELTRALQRRREAINAIVANSPYYRIDR